MIDGYEVGYSRRARDQLARLRRYIAAQATAVIAADFTDAIQQKCDSLERFPHRGTLRTDLGRGLRSIAFRRSVTIIYRVRGREVIIVGIVYRGRDLAEALRD